MLSISNYNIFSFILSIALSINMCYNKLKEVIMKEVVCNDKSTKEKANTGFLNRFSKVFFIIAIIVAALTLLALAMSVLTPLLTVVIMVVIILAIILIVVCTLGTIFATDKNPIPKLWSAFKSVSDSTNLVKKISIFSRGNFSNNFSSFSVG